MIHLSEIREPADVRSLSAGECLELADDIRAKIIRTVSHNGGHLSSNLGVVEITLALHRVFDSPRDQLVFDVGHQAYTHKLLTGRSEAFGTLRQFNGLSGFPKCEESEHDLFETGHASTSISAALGLARARDALGLNHHVVALVGDGALTGGMCYEALNDCGNDKTRLIIVLNDNEMSIAKNVGGLSKHLSRLRASKGWNKTKKRVKSSLKRLPGIGRLLASLMHNIIKTIKSFVMDEGFFTSLGFRYLGPIDGHDLQTLEKIFEQAKHFDEPVVIHCATKKGYGYYNAERKPEAFHGTPPFYIENGETQPSDAVLYGRVAVDALTSLAKNDPRIAVVTAAMPLGTSTDRFQAAYPVRFYDVGIAEEHAVTFSAGLAKGGLRPFFFVYSTFLQRGYDQVIHDVCTQNLPVTFLLDRAGLSNEDGKCHQGLFDIAFLRHVPNLTLLAPANGRELKDMIQAIHQLGINGVCDDSQKHCQVVDQAGGKRHSRPVAIRYPKNAASLGEPYDSFPFVLGEWQTLQKGTCGTLLAVGSMITTALRIADSLQKDGISLEVINASTIKPLDEKCLTRLVVKQKPVFTLEEHALAGGFGSAVLEWNAKNGSRLEVTLFGVKDEFVPHGDHQSLLQYVGLDEKTLTQSISTYYLSKKNKHNEGKSNG